MIDDFAIEQEVTDFIHRRFEADCNWTDGNCYYFALILKDRFDGIIYYDVILGHFVAKIGNYYYDHNGRYTMQEDKSKLICWNNYEECYDQNDYSRVFKDCTR